MNVAFTGHRPQKLGGWNEVNFTANAVKNWLAWQVAQLQTEHQPETWITGGALGVDTWAAEAVQAAGLHHTLALPFEGYDARWPVAARNRGAGIRHQASVVQVVMQLSSPGAFQVRNRWMVDNCGLLVAVWDGSPGGTANCVAYARERCGIVSWLGSVDKMVHDDLLAAAMEAGARYFSQVDGHGGDNQPRGLT